MYENSVTVSRCFTKGPSSSRNLTRISKHSVNNVAERAEVDEDDDKEDNSSFGVESVLMVAA